MLNEPVKNFTYLIIVISAFTSFFSCDDDNWIRISEERIYSISGVSAFNNSWLVVHDNKKINQPRVSLLSKNNQLKDLTWPHSSLPYDLEAIHSIPNYDNQYVLMESTGKCYRIIVNSDTEEIRLKGEFKLPGLSESMNLEGLALIEINGVLKVFYGDRGSDSRPSTLFFADYNVQQNEITVVRSYSFSLLEPMSDRRNIADLVFDKKGNLWSAATSDPGNNGPFETKLFRVGKMSKSGSFSLTRPMKSSKTFENEKVEAMTIFKNGILLLTDNENLGSSRYFIRINKLL
tara:strand:- start:1648 stop:2517 length:870 start_codon:yes stop_codon:yes gene_type:complete